MTTPNQPGAPRSARLPGRRCACRTARACDAVLAFGVLALATWTIAYHACLLLGLGAPWALAALAAGLVPCGLLAARHEAGGAPARGGDRRTPGTVPPPHGGRAPTRRRHPSLAGGPMPAAVATGLAVAAAAALALTDWPWALRWALWLAAGVAVLLAAAVRGGSAGPRGSRPGSGAALAWAAALALLALFLVKPNSDDTYYLRQAAWIAEHGRFPLGDTLHSHDVLPAAFSPPLSSYEALVGSLAGVTGISAPVLAFLVAGPAAAALAVLALWRLLRAWEVRMVAPALSVALVFLLFSIAPPGDPAALVGHRPGDFFVARPWQGKVILAAVLVPLLFSLLHEHAARPRRGGLVLLAGAGVAAVGLSPTATFLVPVLAGAYLAPLLPRSPLRAAAGAAAASAYPLGAMVAALIAGGSQPVRWRPRNLAPEVLVVPALGDGALGLLAVSAALAGPLLLASRHARLGTAAAAVAAALAFAPGVSHLVYDLTGLGRPLWRLTWVIPVAALVGVVATQPAARIRSAWLRALPVLGVVALVAIAGTPVWQGRNTGLAGHPALKRDPTLLAVAERLSRLARADDLVLAPAALGSTLIMLDGRVTAVAPRDVYTRALPAGPRARRAERLLLSSFVTAGLGPGRGEDRVRAALRRLGVDIACVREAAGDSRALLTRSGFREILLDSGYWCGAMRSGRVTPRRPAPRAARRAGSGPRSR